jgi:hypothetical protein
LFQCAAFRGPFRQAAVEHINVLGAEHAERPPNARCAAQPRAVIDHDGVVVADAERADVLGELHRTRNHVRQIGRVIGDGIDIEEHRSWNMAGEILRLGVALLRGEVERTVDDAHLRFAEAGGEPVRGHEVLAGGRAGFGHVTFLFLPAPYTNAPRR